LLDTPVDEYTMTTDGSGNVHLLCAGYIADQITVSDSPALLHLVWNGRGWSKPEVVASDASYPNLETVTASKGQRLNIFPEWPRAVISGNQLHVTWFTRNTNDLVKSDHASYQVWYGVKRLDGAAIAPLPQFTPLPTVAPQVPTATPAPLPTPTLAPEAVSAPPIDHAAGWEAPGMITLAIALFPVIGLLGLIIGARIFMTRQRRRVNSRSHWKV
jgi:hypothetical protein